MPIPIPPGAIPAAKKVLTFVGPIALKKAKKYWSTDHGSKVKRGVFQECAIEMFGDKACIVVNEDSGEVVFLTSDTIQSYHYVKEKRKTVPMHTYFYYDIVFKDGSESYVRMRRKYRDAMLSHM
ncbi:MAG: hypothetical protein HDT18_01250 [Oscillibacter sp.]|nr:hypothetical protein [Oscillibacter sp.]